MLISAPASFARGVCSGGWIKANLFQTFSVATLSNALPAFQPDLIDTEEPSVFPSEKRSVAATDSQHMTFVAFDEFVLLKVWAAIAKLR